MAVFDVLLRLQEVLLYLLLPHTSREHQHNYLSRLTENNNICFQEIHGNDGFLHATQVLAPSISATRYVYTKQRTYKRLVQMHSWRLAPWCYCCHTCDHLPKSWPHRERTVRTPKPCCRQRPFRAREKLKNLLERLTLITPHWPQHPDTTGTMSDINFYNPRKKNQRSQTDFHRLWIGETCLISFLISSRPRNCPAWFHNGVSRTLSKIE